MDYPQIIGHTTRDGGIKIDALMGPEEAVKQYKVLTDSRTEKQKEVDRFLDLLEHGQPKKWARPLVWLLRKVVLG